MVPAALLALQVKFRFEIGFPSISNPWAVNCCDPPTTTLAGLGNGDVMQGDPEAVKSTWWSRQKVRHIHQHLLDATPLIIEGVELGGQIRLAPQTHRQLVGLRIELGLL